jgi:uncharacterized protein YkwD
MLALLCIFLVYPAGAARAAGLLCKARETDSPSAGTRGAAPGAGYYYTVQQDDTLWDIAAMHDLTLDEIVAVNPLVVPELLQPGQTVFLPAGAVTATQTLAAAEPVVPALPVSGQGVASAGQVQGSAGSAGALAPAPEGAELLQLINKERAAYGLPVLAWSADLAQAAQSQAADCAQRDWGSHYGSDGSTLRMRLARVGYTPSEAGENWANTQDAGQAFAMWWDEAPGADPHRRNILGPEFDEVGIGASEGSWGYYFVADFACR